MEDNNKQTVKNTEDENLTVKNTENNTLTAREIFEKIAELQKQLTENSNMSLHRRDLLRKNYKSLQKPSKPFILATFRTCLFTQIFINLHTKCSVWLKFGVGDFLSDF